MSDSSANDWLDNDADSIVLRFEEHREKLTRMVRLRLDRRLQGRVDASDIIQDASLEATRRLEEYRRERPMSLFLWLRWLVNEQLIMATRRHLLAEKRDIRREIRINQASQAAASSALLAAHIVGSMTGPSAAVIREERRLRVQQAIEQLDEKDREIIALRGFEQLTRAETAEILGMEESAVAKRYIRALQRLKAAVRNISPSSCTDQRGPH